MITFVSRKLTNSEQKWLNVMTGAPEVIVNSPAPGRGR